MASSVSFGDVQPILGLLALVATALFAWRQGGRAERLGGLLLVTGSLIGGVAHQLIGHPSGVAAMLSDSIDATGFVLVAVRYSSLWLAPTLLVYSGGFAVRAIQFGVFGCPAWLESIDYAALTVGLSYLVLVIIACATFATMIERRRVRAFPA